MKLVKLRKQPAPQPMTVVKSHLMDLHLLSMKVLKEVKARRSLIGQIERATTNAVLAFEQASVGFRQRYQLRRTHAALVVCRQGFAMLYLEGYLRRRAFDEIRRRVDQLAAIFAQLEQLPTAEWETISIPPIAQPSLGAITPILVRRGYRRAAPLAKGGEQRSVFDVTRFGTRSRRKRSIKR
jgi:hypothetical protein